MKLAVFISRITEPMVLIVALILLGAWQAGLRGLPLTAFILYLLIFFSIMWIARVRTMRLMKTNWDISDRVKRVRSFGPLLGVCAVFFLSILFWRNSWLTVYVLSLFVWMVGFAIITLRTKISGHVSVLTLTLGYMIIWYGSSWLSGIVLVPLLAWSRLVLKRHTMAEVVGGFLYSLVFLILIHQLG